CPRRRRPPLPAPSLARGIRLCRRRAAHAAPAPYPRDAAPWLVLPLAPARHLPRPLLAGLAAQRLQLPPLRDPGALPTGPRPRRQLPVIRTLPPCSAHSAMRSSPGAGGSGTFRSEVMVGEERAMSTTARDPRPYFEQAGDLLEATVEADPVCLYL